MRRCENESIEQMKKKRYGSAEKEKNDNWEEKKKKI